MALTGTTPHCNPLPVMLLPIRDCYCWGEDVANSTGSEGTSLLGLVQKHARTLHTTVLHYNRATPSCGASFPFVQGPNQKQPGAEVDAAANHASHKAVIKNNIRTD